MTSTFLLVREDREYLRAPGEELQTDLGVLTVPEDVEPGQRLETHLGEEFVVREPRGPDLFDHFERTGAPMMPRDIGLVVGMTGAAADDRVLDAGTGTGVLAAYLGRIGAAVRTYEQDPEFADVARENMRLAGVADRVDVRTGDVTAELDALAAEPGFDLLTLDTADAPSVVRRAPDLLLSGGFVVVYSPFVEGTRAAVEAAEEAGLTGVETHETIQRRMQFDERGSRPDTRGVGHTGYLTVGRLS
ncbi:methyltransferase domain-containing protein [Haloplanus rallus]|uniref:Methyltransferase domain-containing protein n=1 Tax=Haloplanus rallus TaxID=1816183 RepID=A0A6B9F070_9EURY|nr:MULTISPECIES: 50S ribosomal protein L11 methyltransferase [Haloplanus]QGX93536.1 methyltransferase domain-containing protein [Haloplanus rallus]